jgi:hypothetical protein
MKRLLVAFIVFVSLGFLAAATPLRQDMTTVWTQLMNQVYSGFWADAVTVAGATNPLGADGQATVNNDAAKYIGCLEFDAAGETAVAQFQLPHSLKDATDVKPHVHWYVSGADVTGSSVFAAKFRHCPLAATCGAWTDWANGTVATEPADEEGGTGMTYWTMADATYNFGISDVILMQFKLGSTTVTDSMVCTVDAHFKGDAFGSLNETAR